jgi:hypothetical protein
MPSAAWAAAAAAAEPAVAVSASQGQHLSGAELESQALGVYYAMGQVVVADGAGLARCSRVVTWTGGAPGECEPRSQCLALLLPSFSLSLSRARSLSR